MAILVLTKRSVNHSVRIEPSKGNSYRASWSANVPKAGSFVIIAPAFDCLCSLLRWCWRGARQTSHLAVLASRTRCPLYKDNEILRVPEQVQLQPSLGESILWWYLGHGSDLRVFQYLQYPQIGLTPQRVKKNQATAKKGCCWSGWEKHQPRCQSQCHSFCHDNRVGVSIHPHRSWHIHLKVNKTNNKQH